MSLAPQSARCTSEDLAALISSRICHDLINPMGAISNGLELLEAVSKSLGPELELVADSVANATARLNFFRVAFGLADEASELKTAHLQKVVNEMFTMRRFTPQITTTSIAVPRRAARTMLLLLLCAESAMPMGGTLQITEVPGGWNIEATGRRVQIEAPLWDALLAATPPATTAGDVHFAAAALALREYGLSLAFHTTEDALSLTLREAALAAAPV